MTLIGYLLAGFIFAVAFGIISTCVVDRDRLTWKGTIIMMVLITAFWVLLPVYAALLWVAVHKEPEQRYEIKMVEINK